MASFINKKELAGSDAESFADHHVNTWGGLELDMPDVEKGDDFQLIVFPFPYEVNADNYESQQTFGSFRVVIQSNA